MAGMLPGVECARRRRIHQGGTNDPQSRTRRSSFCLYTTSHDAHLSANSMIQLRSALSRSFRAEELGDVAREAKERLDEKLGTQRKSDLRRHKSLGNLISKDGGGHQSLGAAILANLHKDVFDPKRRGGKKFSWVRLGWKASEQTECAVCLERVKSGEILVHLPCAHRFHPMCLVPWFESNSHCPYCRTQVTHA